MQRLSKEKRNQLILILLLAVGVICGLYLGFIKPQRETLAGLPGEITAAQTRLETMRKAIRGADSLEMDLKTANGRVSEIENEMAAGDLNAWFYSAIKDYKKNFPVDIPQLSTPDVGDCTLLPKFPYKRARVSVGGTAYFHDLGRFLAHFENDFPYFQLQNVSIERAPGNTGQPADRETLSFRMDIVALIKPGSS